ncbi:MAG: response regulator [Nitrospirales bacterium]|nr:response regulator [Nitrospirales bacterium]
MKNVLIVDDEESILSILSEYLSLETENVRLITATNGKKAMEILESSHAIDLVITDLRMPVMSGYELLQYMTKKHPQTPVIVMSGYSDHGIIETIKKKISCHYIEKPFLFDDLALAVKGLI